MSEISDRVSFAGRHGAGLYGAPAPTHVTKCVNSRNPFGHNKECPCGWWPPISEELEPVYPESRWPDDAA